eukprot:6251299-Alexandrium_andersonii.AAC.1
MAKYSGALDGRAGVRGRTAPGTATAAPSRPGTGTSSPASPSNEGIGIPPMRLGTSKTSGILACRRDGLGLACPP